MASLRWGTQSAYLAVYAGADAVGKSRTWRIGENTRKRQEGIEIHAPMKRVERRPIVSPR